jgi:hypothetical protein
LSEGLTAPSIGWADSLQPYRSNDVGRRNREENAVLPERCGVCIHKLVLM